MKKHLIKSSIALAALTVVCAQANATKPMPPALPGPVVSTQWLADHLSSVQVVEIRADARSFIFEPTFKQDERIGEKVVDHLGGHVPAARLVDLKSLEAMDDAGNAHAIPDAAGFEKALQAAGVDAKRPMVLVAPGLQESDMESVLRVYLGLKIHGQDFVAVLDGGMSAWLSEGRPYSTERASAKVGTWFAQADRSAQYLATTAEVEAAVAQKAPALIDVRDVSEYLGKEKSPEVFASGHIEGAKLYNRYLKFKESSGSVKMLSANTYRTWMEQLEIDADAPAIAYGNTGDQAAATWFILSQVMGNANAKLYEGSLSKWTKEFRPVVLETVASQP